MRTTKRNLPARVLFSRRSRGRTRSRGGAGGRRRAGGGAGSSSSSSARTRIGATRATVVVVPSRDEGLIRGATVGADAAGGLEGGEEGGLAEAGEPAGLVGAGGTAILGVGEGGTGETTCWEGAGGGRGNEILVSSPGSG